MQITLIILIIIVILFVWGKYPPDIIALLSMISLFIFGVLNQEEALSGFSNPTVVMIAGLFIIGEGLASTGWTALAAQQLIKWSQNSKLKMLMLLTMGAGFLSGFVSNTGTVATLLPISVTTAWKIGVSPSKLLMPVAFGSNTGGLLTLTGTPPNIIVSNALADHGLEQFSFFEFSLIGLPLLIIAMLYLRFVGYRLLPSYQPKEHPATIDSELSEYLENYSIDGTIFKLRVRSMSPLINTKIEKWDLENKYGVSIIRVKKGVPRMFMGIPGYVEFPTSQTEMHYQDTLTVKGDPDGVNRMMIDLKLGLLPSAPIKTELKEDLITQEVGLSEVFITPRSFFVGKQIPIGGYLEQLGLQLLAVSRNNKPLNGNHFKLKAGDALIVRGTWENIEELQALHENVLVSGKPESLSKDVDQLTYKSWISLASLVFLVVALVLKILPGAIAALVAAGVCLLSGCVPFAKAYQRISWGAVIMIAAMIPMGTALQKTGLAQLMATGLVDQLGEFGPAMLLAGIFILTAGFSQTINNSATAVLMAPIAIIAANQIGASPQPFMIGVAISASTAFLTPVGTTTNALVMAAGSYKFMDYFRVGTPLLILFLIVSMIFVPMIWPF